MDDSSELKKETRGGARPGSGQPRKPPEILNAEIPETDDPIEFLTRIMNDKMADGKIRIAAAKSLMPFVHARKNVGGKKEQRQKAAEKVGQGRFSPSVPPKLAVVGK